MLTHIFNVTTVHKGTQDNLQRTLLRESETEIRGECCKSVAAKAFCVAKALRATLLQL